MADHVTLDLNSETVNSDFEAQREAAVMPARELLTTPGFDPASLIDSMLIIIGSQRMSELFQEYQSSDKRDDAEADLPLRITLLLLNQIYGNTASSQTQSFETLMTSASMTYADKLSLLNSWFLAIRTDWPLKDAVVATMDRISSDVFSRSLLLPAAKLSTAETEKVAATHRRMNTGMLNTQSYLQMVDAKFANRLPSQAEILAYLQSLDMEYFREPGQSTDEESVIKVTDYAAKLHDQLQQVRTRRVGLIWRTLKALKANPELAESLLRQAAEAETDSEQRLTDREAIAALQQLGVAVSDDLEDYAVRAFFTALSQYAKPAPQSEPTSLKGVAAA